MRRTIETSAERKKEAVRYITERIDKLNYQIKQCDYTEDVDGNPIYQPDAYYEEKCGYLVRRKEWETILRIVSSKLPTYYWDD